MRILVPVDGSQHSRRALQFIREASELTGTRPEVELLSVQSFVSDGMARMFGAEAVKKAYTDEGLKVFEGMGEEIAALGEGVRKEVGFGDPGAAVKHRRSVRSSSCATRRPPRRPRNCASAWRSTARSTATPR